MGFGFELTGRGLTWAPKVEPWIVQGQGEGEKSIGVCLE